VPATNQTSPDHDMRSGLVWYSSRAMYDDLPILADRRARSFDPGVLFACLSRNRTTTRGTALAYCM